MYKNVQIKIPVAIKKQIKKGNSMKKNVKNRYNVYGMAFLLSALMYTLTCILANIYPFGNTSNLIWDLNLQYMDFFAYLKRVLTGEVNFDYSFSKSLGGSLIATYGYYLASPFNLLVIFFKTEKLQLFIYFITMIKIGMSGLTFSVFVCNRFPKLKNEYGIMFSLEYAFSQYIVGQVSNIMWLDGVYMLPIIMLGVYRLVKLNKKKILYLGIAISVLFNWYTGYMNCLFVPFYFLMEELLHEKENKSVCIKNILIKGIKLCSVEILGVMLSGVLFIPVVYGLLQGKGVEKGNIFEWVTNGKIMDIFRGFVIGSNVNTREISLYCGLLVLILCISFLANKKVVLYEKTIIGLAVIFCVVICFFRPLENIWNGFRIASSYFYRFSYLTIFMLIFMAAFGIEKIEEKNTETVFQSAGIVIGIFFVLDTINAFDSKYLWISVFFSILYGILLYAGKKKSTRIIMLTVLFVELTVNGRKVFLSVYTESADYYPNYVSQQETLIDEIKNYDSATYRLDETEKRTCSANLNESMSYGYYSISHYDSAYDMNVAEFLSNMGYANFLDFSLYDEPILPIDSLLGEKYLLSGKKYDGYEEVKSIKNRNYKQVYYNENALPFGFGVSEKIYNSNDGENPFERINSVYSNILGRDIKIFYPREIEGTISDNKIEYVIPDECDENHIFFGCADSNITDLGLEIDGEYRCNYQGWFNRYMFNIGNGSREHTVCFNGFSGVNNDIHTMIYYMDLTEFEAIIQDIKNKQVNDIIIKDGYISGEYNAEEGNKIMFTVPYASGWEATINGEKVSIGEGLNTFIVLNVEKGNNRIEMRYHAPWVNLGKITSVMSLIVYVTWCCMEKKIWKRKKSR